MKRLDVNKDGKLSDEEISALQPVAKRAGGKKKIAAVAKPEPADPAKAELFAKYDANKNGTLDPEEASTIRKDYAADPKGALAKIDTDADGKLDDEELAALKGGAMTSDTTAGKPGKKGGGKKNKAAK